MPSFQEAVEYLEKLEDGKVKSYKLAVKFPEYGVTTFPQLLLFLGTTPFKYDKPDDFAADSIVDWVEEAKQTPVPELTEETFEHLTQSSTGATTGDWMVMFANSKRPECMKPHLPDIGTAALRLRRRKNVA
uniref:Thioredoxin domain-containing protein n=1 Tax=Ciona savignyi TaxID=51511 RepID=H2Z4L4_CIOSA